MQPLTWARLDLDPTTYTNAVAQLNSDPLPISTSNLTDILKALGHSDELGLKKYRRAIAEVPVCRSGLGGAVLYKTSREHQCDGHADFCREGTCLHLAKYFQQRAVQDGTSHLMFDPQPRPTLHGLPEHIRVAIFRHTVPDRAGYEWYESFGWNSALLGVNQALRRWSRLHG